MTTTARDHRVGGCSGIRRRFVSAIVLLAIAAAPLDALAPEASPSETTVTVQEHHGVYVVTARFEVPQQAPIAFAVLTDYERIPQFMPGVETSVVIQRGAGRAVVEQDAVSHLMMFTRRVHLVLDIVEGPDTLSFQDRSGCSFARYEGTWRLSEAEGGTWISYQLTAQPAFDVPEFVLKKLLKRDSGRMIEGLRREMRSRAARPLTS